MAQFVLLAALADQLATEPSRLKKRAAIAEAIGSIAAKQEGAIAEHALNDAGLFCLYLAGLPFPEADPRKLNAGGALLTRALKDVSHCTDAALTAAYRRHGDLGAAAFDVLYTNAPAHATLTLDELSVSFDAMATARSTAARSATLIGLLQRATAIEAKYLLKLMLNDMRIGVKQSLIEEAIAVASGTGAVEVRHAVMLEADLARAVTMAFTNTLDEAHMRLFHPLGFMLASPVETPEEAVERFTPKPAKVEKPKAAKKARRKKGEPEEAAEEFVDLPAIESIEPAAIAEGRRAEGVPPAAQVQAYLEDKYDGMRAQLHCGDPGRPGRVVIYSRNREDITQSFPELAEAFANVSAPESGPLILDGEILGWDLAAGKALPFATLGQRIGRKKVDDELRRQIPVVFMAFDLLFQDEVLLLDLPLRERRARLEKLAGDLAGVAVSTIDAPEDRDRSQFSMFDTGAANAEPAIARLLLSPAKLVESAEAIDQAYADARARANEGVMIKAADSVYLPGRRGLSWVKLKRELATLDVVITGAEYGHGKRAGLLSDYTFAVQGPRGELLNVGKAYSGVTDVEILELTAWLKAHTLEDHGHFRTVEPIRVLEVAFNNIMRSTRHASGFALRFPRIIRIRDDKPLEEIDTLARVEEIYQSQPDRPEEAVNSE
jgi:DNA ligase 1